MIRHQIIIHRMNQLNNLVLSVSKKNERLTEIISSLTQDRSVEFVNVLYTDVSGKLNSIVFNLKAIEHIILSKQLINIHNQTFIMDLDTAFIDSFSIRPTLSIFANKTNSSISKDAESFDPRSELIDTLNNTEITLQTNDIYEMKELKDLEFQIIFEFKILTKTQEDQEDQVENLSYIFDKWHDIRSEIMHEANAMNVAVLSHYYGDGKCVITLDYVNAITCADNIQKLRYIISNVVMSYGFTPNFTSDTYLKIKAKATNNNVKSDLLYKNLLNILNEFGNNLKYKYVLSNEIQGSYFILDNCFTSYVDSYIMMSFLICAQISDNIGSDKNQSYQKILDYMKILQKRDI